MSELFISYVSDVSEATLICNSAWPEQRILRGRSISLERRIRRRIESGK